MSSTNHPSPESILRMGLAELSLAFNQSQIDSFMSYLLELKKWNKAYNLTGLKTDEEIVVKHFLDSLLYLKALPEGAISVMDVGSGAGFPGIPMKIMRPEISMYLIEPSRKKANFLMHIIKTLKMELVEVIEKRIEEVKSVLVDVAVTRALFDVREFYKKAAHLVHGGGRMVMNKGPKAQEELKAAGNVGYETISVKLPCSNIKRLIIVIEKKVSKTPAKKNEGVAILHRTAETAAANICFNLECRLRKAGCRGFEGCPGFKERA